MGSFTFADTCETLLKVDRIFDDWRKVKSWLMNFRHHSGIINKLSEGSVIANDQWGVSPFYRNVRGV